MKIVWDEPKRLANLAKHGLDFADLDEAFFEHAIVVPGRIDRMVAVGRHSRGVSVVVFKPMGHEAISIISMRPANAKERDLLS
jgi:uncharacterized DUF497 family protein